MKHVRVMYGMENHTVNAIISGKDESFLFLSNCPSPIPILTYHIKILCYRTNIIRQIYPVNPTICVSTFGLIVSKFSIYKQGKIDRRCQLLSSGKSPFEFMIAVDQFESMSKAFIIKKWLTLLLS